MFTVAELQLIKKNCPTEFDALLNRLSISIARTSDDEYRVYEELDADLMRQICALMKSPSVIVGYTTLLDIGGVAYDYSETDNELLAKVVANKNKIQLGLERMPKFVEVEVEEFLSEPQPIQSTAPPQPKTKTITHEEHFTLKGPIILGSVLIVAGLVLMFMVGIGGIILALLGVASVMAGVLGKTVKTTKTVLTDEKISLAPQPVRQSARKKIVRQEKKPPFTPNELQKILDVLTQLDKIVRAI